MTLTELLGPHGFLPNSKAVKIVRHKDSRVDIESLHRDGWLETYQQYESKPVFDGCQQVVATIGEEGLAARFIGVYDVGVRRASANEKVPLGCPHPEWETSGYFYPLIKRVGFEDLAERVVIGWGKGALAWCQRYSDREVIEVRRRGRALPPFRDYLRVDLTFHDLRQLVTNAGAHRDWHVGLSAVGAIYLIVDTLTGQQYVGSATGEGGVWRRWCGYAKGGHGNNVRLKGLCVDTHSYPAAFRFSILETFSRSLSRDEALSLERFFKRKLGTRAFGLNAN